MTTNALPPVQLMTPTEVAREFRVDPKTVTRWAKAGKLPFILTLGGHRRYPRAAVLAAMGVSAAELDTEADQSTTTTNEETES
ncbi:BldC family transcriptional regulator [Promicromonospora sp. NPDC023805]|uniref:BldC family transcriptional regulator n=1 Tax=Promicromonospora sp. NPDC023805 TaxID=3154696 RepID=UPI0033F78FFB